MFLQILYIVLSVLTGINLSDLIDRHSYKKVVITSLGYILAAMFLVFLMSSCARNDERIVRNNHATNRIIQELKHVGGPIEVIAQEHRGRYYLYIPVPEGHRKVEIFQTGVEKK